MTDASILIPTYRHAALLPYALRSALDQRGASVEVLVVGDGVEDATREVIADFGDDPRMRFFDFPKRPRHGEPSRHEALQQARGRIVCYLSDDDLLLPDHVAEMCRLLADADFAHGPYTQIGPASELQYFPWNYARPAFVELARMRVGSIGLTGVAHTLEAYHHLPFGWRTTPRGLPTDHSMWLQWLDLPELRMVMGERLTYLSFPEPLWGSLADSERAATLAEWLARSRARGFADELDAQLRTAILRTAEDYHLWREHHWRARRRLVGLRLRRALLARRPGAR